MPIKVRDGGAWVEVSGAISSFIGLSDTPDSYTSFGGKVVKVNSSEDALEFVDSTGVGTDNYVTDVGFSNGTLTLERTGSLGSLTTSIDVSSGTVTDVTVSQTSYSGTNPITVTSPSSGTEQINIPDNSNAYGTRFVETYTPTTQGNNGDVWYQVS